MNVQHSDVIIKAVCDFKFFMILPSYLEKENYHIFTLFQTFTTKDIFMEKKQHASYQSSDNLLKEFYDGLLKMHRTFKTQVLRDCGYSMPKYYRKVNGGLLSNADRNKIISIKDRCLQHLEIFSTHWKTIITKGKDMD